LISSVPAANSDFITTLYSKIQQVLKAMRLRSCKVLNYMTKITVHRNTANENLQSCIEYGIRTTWNKAIYCCSIV